MKLSRAKAVEHKCHQCMGEYVDGMVDCEIVTCALYAWHPYRKLEPVTDWQNWTPRGRGRRRYKVTSKRSKHQISNVAKVDRA